MKPYYWMGFIVVALFAATLGLELAGSVVVVDPERRIVSARLIGGGRSQPLHALPGNRFYGISKLEGAVEVRCRNGSTDVGGYVTPHLDTRLKMTLGAECGLS